MRSCRLPEPVAYQPVSLESDSSLQRPFRIGFSALIRSEVRCATDALPRRLRPMLPWALWIPGGPASAPLGCEHRGAQRAQRRRHSTACRPAPPDPVVAACVSAGCLGRRIRARGLGCNRRRDRAEALPLSQTPQSAAWCSSIGSRSPVSRSWRAPEGAHRARLGGFLSRVGALPLGAAPVGHRPKPVPPRARVVPRAAANDRLGLPGGVPVRWGEPLPRGLAECPRGDARS